MEMQCVLNGLQLASHFGRDHFGPVKREVEVDKLGTLVNRNFKIAAVLAG